MKLLFILSLLILAVGCQSPSPTAARKSVALSTGAKPPMPPLSASSLAPAAVVQPSVGTITIEPERVTVRWTRANGLCSFYISDGLGSWQSAGSFTRKQNGAVTLVDESERPAARFYQFSTSTP